MQYIGIRKTIFKDFNVEINKELIQKFLIFFDGLKNKKNFINNAFNYIKIRKKPKEKQEIKHTHIYFEKKYTNIYRNIKKWYYKIPYYTKYFYVFFAILYTYWKEEIYNE